MTKEDIIEKFKNEKVDEGRLYHDRRADEVSLLIFMLLTIVAAVISKNIEILLLTIGTFLVAIGFGDIYRYVTLKSKKLLIKGLIYSVFGSLWYLCFVFKTLGLL